MYRYVKLENIFHYMFYTRRNKFEYFWFYVNVGILCSIDYKTIKEKLCGMQHVKFLFGKMEYLASSRHKTTCREAFRVLGIKMNIFSRYLSVVPLCRIFQKSVIVSNLRKD